MEWSAETWEEEGTAELVLQQNVSRLEVRLGDEDQLEGEDIPPLALGGILLAPRWFFMA